MPESRLPHAKLFVAFQVFFDELLEPALAVDHRPGAQDADEGIPDPIVARDPVRRHRNRGRAEPILRFLEGTADDAHRRSAGSRGLGWRIVGTPSSAVASPSAINGPPETIGGPARRR